MVTNYKGRKITAVARRLDGFKGVVVRLNGVEVRRYSAMSSANLCTVEGAIAQTKVEIDAIDAYADDFDRPRFARCWYAKTDPRYRLAHD